MESCSLIPWDTSHFEKLIVAQVVKKFPAFYGTQRFIIMFTGNLTLSQMHPHIY
jgi:hypothetical protein